LSASIGVSALPRPGLGRPELDVVPNIIQPNAGFFNPMPETNTALFRSLSPRHPRGSGVDIFLIV